MEANDSTLSKWCGQLKWHWKKVFVFTFFTLTLILFIKILKPSIYSKLILFGFEVMYRRSFHQWPPGVGMRFFCLVKTIWIASKTGVNVTEDFFTELFLHLQLFLGYIWIFSYFCSIFLFILYFCFDLTRSSVAPTEIALLCICFFEKEW